MTVSKSGSIAIDFRRPASKIDGTHESNWRQLKILLLYPNFPMTHLLLPAGVSIISACLKQAGHDTRLFDTTLYKPQGDSMDDIRIEMLQLKKVSTENRKVEYKTTEMVSDFQRVIQEYQPDLVGVSLLQDTFPIALPLMEEAHRAGIPVLAGGIYPTFAPDDLIDNECVDMVCRGEGELPIVELCNCLATDSSYDQVPNLWIKKPDGTILKNHMGPTMNVDELPPPDYEIFEAQRFFRPMQGRLLRIMPIEMHRGCPYQCAFCEDPMQSKLYREIGERFHRSKGPGKLLEELKILLEKYGAEYIYFNAETFFAMPNSHFEELAQRYAEEIALPFWMQTRPETLTV
jgi:anaerobic magnesium-protoporphyrin IX monomethyl ester cyclase